MDLGSKGQKQPPVSRNYGKRHGLSFIARGKPSAQELGNRPSQPRFSAVPVEGGLSKALLDHALGISQLFQA